MGKLGMDEYTVLLFIIGLQWIVIPFFIAAWLKLLKNRRTTRDKFHVVEAYNGEKYLIIEEESGKTAFKVHEKSMID